MAKFYGDIGFIQSGEDPNEPGVWLEETILNKKYYGDVFTIFNSINPKSDSTNNDVMLNMKVSILADKFAIDNISRMAYIDYEGTKWTIKSATITRPRITLELGGVYNG